MKKVPKSATLQKQKEEFLRKLQDDPVSALSELGIELVEEEVERVRQTLPKLIERSLQTMGSASMTHRVERIVGDSKITVILSQDRGLNITGPRPGEPTATPTDQTAEATPEPPKPPKPPRKRARRDPT